MTLAFAIFLLSPTLWRVWHNHVHHAHTNSEVYDPDNFGTLSRCRLSRWVRFAAAVTLGEGNWLRLLCVPLWFSAHVQVVLWAQSRACLGFERLNRNRAIAETLGLVAFWMALCCSFGLDFTLLVVVLPMLVANTIIMSYVATNHLLRPLVIEPDLLETSMSVHTNRWLDIIHFKFSHHVEHHLFPTMSSRHASRVRQKLHEHAADRFLAPAHWAALRLVFATPRIHDGKAALVSPRGGARVVFEQLTEALRCKTSNGTTAPRPKSTSY
jgi:fatty acid desaturase